MPNVNHQTIHQMGGINDVFRQALGLDNTRNIDMDWVTVAQNKRLRIVDTFTGNPITFTAEKAGEIIGAEVEMYVKQNLNGQSYPWPAGCGVNIAPYPVSECYYCGYSFQMWANGYSGCRVSGTETGISFTRNNNSVGCGIILGTLEAGQTYTLKATRSNTQWSATLVIFDADAVLSLNNGIDRTAVYSNVDIEAGLTFVANSGNIKYAINFYTNQLESVPLIVSDIRLVKGDTAPAFTPYQNICPITPWESVLITVNDKDRLTEFPQQVYNGSFNTMTGILVIKSVITTVGAHSWAKLTEDRFQTALQGIEPAVAAYRTPLSCSAYKAIIAIPPITPPLNYPDFSIWTNGGSKNNVVIRDSRFSSAADFKTAMGDTQICYPLANPIILQLDKEEIPAVEGENTVSTNASTLTVTLYEAGDI